ncbi:MAG: hypothetical protein ACYC3I_00545 [Gemmataceae bacterium]
MPECPLCKVKVGANDFLSSAEAACSVCGNRSLAPPPSPPWWVSAAPLETIESKAAAPAPPMEPWWVASDAPEPKRPVVTQLAPPEPMAAPKPNEPESVPSVAVPPPLPPRVAPSQSPPPARTPSVADDEPTTLLDRLRTLDFGSGLAFLCFSVALLFGSFVELEAFIKPMAALGLLAGLLGGVLPALWRGMNAVFPFLLSVPCLLVLLFAGSWPDFSSSPPPLVAVPLKQKGMTVHQPVGADDWVDATANAVKQGDVRVEIVSAQVGRVDLKQKSSATKSSERYLMIRVRVSYEGVVFRQTPYEPWADRADSPSKHTPTLTDNQGRTYPQKTFDPGWNVVGRADGDALNPGHQVKEVLVYPIPERGVEHLRLMLPASAFGLAGAFRFQIPRSTIGGL